MGWGEHGWAGVSTGELVGWGEHGCVPPAAVPPWERVIAADDLGVVLGGFVLPVAWWRGTPAEVRASRQEPARTEFCVPPNA